MYHSPSSWFSCSASTSALFATAYRYKWITVCRRTVTLIKTYIWLFLALWPAFVSGLDHIGILSSAAVASFPPLRQLLEFLVKWDIFNISFKSWMHNCNSYSPIDTFHVFWKNHLNFINLHLNWQGLCWVSIYSLEGCIVQYMHEWISLALSCMNIISLGFSFFLCLFLVSFSKWCFLELGRFRSASILAIHRGLYWNSSYTGITGIAAYTGIVAILE